MQFPCKPACLIAMVVSAAACGDDTTSNGGVTDGGGNSGAAGGGGVGAQGSGGTGALGSGGVSGNSGTGAVDGGGLGGGVSATPLVWFSDWRSGAGTTDAIIKDGGKWNDNLCSGASLVSAVPATSLGLPAQMTHTFRVEYDPAVPCYMLATHDQWPAPTVGQYFFGRIYYRAEISSGVNLNQAHPFQGGAPGGNGSYLWFVNTVGTAPNNLWQFQIPGADYPYNRFGVAIGTGATYRYEFRLHWYTTTAAKISLRLYREDGSLLADDDDFHGQDGADSLANVDPDLPVPEGGQSFRQWELGNNDAGVQGAGEYQFWGGAAVRISDDADDWIGPYPAAEEAL